MATINAPITSVAVKKIYPLVSKSLSSNTAKYKRNLQAFFNARSKDIYDTAPYSRLMFGEDEAQDFFKSINITKEQIHELLTETYYWKMNFSPAAAKDELTMTMMMIIRYFLKKGDKVNTEISAIYLAFSGRFYPSIHYGQFPKAQPSEYRHIMEYVVNNMLTMKFDLKREGSLFGAIRSICRTWLEKYGPIIKGDMDDEENAEIIKQLHGRIKSFIINIASLYYEAHENKNYLTYDSDMDNEESFRLADNDSLRIERAVENAMNFINNNNVDFRLCTYASDSNVKVNEVKSIIEGIQDDKVCLGEIKELFRIIIAEYFQVSTNKNLASTDFVSKSITSKPNTKNKNILRQKEIIEGWLDEKSPQYRKRRSRPETKSSYYKSILKYYVLVINKANR